jgi:hypothetical protein
MIQLPLQILDPQKPPLFAPFWTPVGRQIYPKLPEGIPKLAEGFYGKGEQTAYRFVIAGVSEFGWEQAPGRNPLSNCA